MTDELYDEALASYKPQTLAVPPTKRGRGRPKKDDSESSDKAIKPTEVVTASEEEAKKAREAAKAELQKRKRELTESITEGLNEQLFDILIVLGIPENLLYKDQRPNKAKKNSPYTEGFGDVIAIPDHVAGSWANVIARFERTKTGKSLIAKTTGESSDNIALVLASILAISSTAGYVFELKKLYTQIQPLLVQMKDPEQPDEPAETA